MHFILFFRVAPLIRGRRVVDELANVVSTEIIPGCTLQEIEVDQTDKQAC